MRILMLSSSYPRYPGETTAPFIEEIAAGLAARGHDVRLLAPFHPDLRREPVARGVSLGFFRYAPHPALNVWGYAQSLVSDTAVKRATLAVAPFALSAASLNLAREAWAAQRAGQPFDVIHAHWVLPNGPPAELAARLTGLPLAISLHGSDIYLAESHWLLAGLSGAAFRAAAAISACSSDLHQRALRIGAPLSRTRVIPYGVDPEQFRPDPSARARVFGRLGLQPNQQLVLGLGRLVAKKGFGVLIDAWPQVRAACPEAVLVIAGYGDLREPLERQARDLGLTEHVRFTGQLDRALTADVVAAADLFALPIVRDGVDGLPNVLLEAMAAARPVVASRVAGVPDVIEDGVHGLLVPERSPAPLAEALIRLLRDRDLAQQFGAAARARIEAELTWQQTAARYEAFLASALAQG